MGNRNQVTWQAAARVRVGQQFRHPQYGAARRLIRPAGVRR